MKIAKYLMMLAAAAGLAVACQKEEKTVFDPEAVVAPVLQPVEDIVVTDDNMDSKVTFTWSKADFGLNVVPSYTLLAKYADNPEVTVVKGVADPKAEVAIATLNGIFFNDLKMPAGVESKVSYRVFACLTDSDNYYSEAVEANFTAKESEKVFPPSIYGVVGTLNGWAAPDVNMGDAGDGMYVAKNVVFDQAENKFKIRANEEWKDDANFGLEAAGPIEPDKGYPVISSGGSGDMTVPKGTYDIWFDLTNMMVYAMTPGKHPKDAGQGEVVVPVDPATLEWYVVGQFNNWATADANYKLTKSEDGKYFVLKGFAADGNGFKFHAAGEDNWAVNRGAAEGEAETVAAPVGEPFALAQAGKNISLAVGTYDIYVSSTFDKVEFFNEGEEPAKYGEWIYVPGNHQGWAPATAPALRSENKDGIYTGFVNFNGDFKFTHVRDWKGEYNSTHFTTYADGFAASTDGTNITAPAGYYYVVVNVPEKKIEATSVAWGIVGTAAGSWDVDKDMSWDSTKKCWTATVELAAGEWKFRANHGWDLNLGGAEADLVANGGNMNLAEAGTYVVELYTERTTNDKIYCTLTK